MSFYSRKKEQLQNEINNLTLTIEICEKANDVDAIEFYKKEKKSLEAKLRTVIRKEREE